MNTQELAVSVLQEKQPGDRGEAFTALKEAGHTTGGGQYFNDVMNAYAKATGITLAKSKAGKARDDKEAAIAWAHNATQEEVVVCLMQEGSKSQKFWAAWKLHKEGKWPELDTHNIFVQHFTAKETDPGQVELAVAKLVEAKPNTRGEAYNILVDERGQMDNRVYSAAVKQYETLAKTVLSVAASTLKRPNILATVHAFSAKEIHEHMVTMGDPDQIFWTALGMQKEGKWDKDVKRSDFSKHFTRQPQKQTAAVAESNKKTGVVEMDDDMPF